MMPVSNSSESIVAPPEVKGGSPANQPATTKPPAEKVTNNVINVNAKIMIVDDEPVNIKIVRKYLQSVGYNNFITSDDSTRTIQLIYQEQPDIVLLDVIMPDVSGLDILGTMNEDELLQHVPVLIVTASTDPVVKLEALLLGATDILSKPVDRSELMLRVRNALILKAHHDQLSDQAGWLQNEVRRRTWELEASRRDLIHCLALAAECRDNQTGQHIYRVSFYVERIALQLGFSEELASSFAQAAQLHDVGKIGISDLILNKPAELSDEEYALMRTHCELGHKIMLPALANEKKFIEQRQEQSSLTDAGPPLIALAVSIAGSHHERWDGSGYPKGLAGETIPIEGRITAVADVFDALSNKRPYKPAFPLEKCFELIKAGRGTQFDPRVVDAFFARKDEIIAIREQYADGVEL